MKSSFLLRTRRFVCLALAVSCIAFSTTLPTLAQDVVDPEDVLDVHAMELTFTEDFDTLSVSAWGGGTRWIAHTPWAGDFGKAEFTDPKPGFPFVVNQGILRIEARKDDTGKWRSGLLSAMDQEGRGFAQQYGYFEMRAKLPKGAKLWSAFWLVGKNRANAIAEIDILEYYGDSPDGYESVIHVWRENDDNYSRYQANKVFADGTDAEDFNTFGAKIDENWTKFYFNRNFLWKTPTQPEHKQPLFPLLNLAIVWEDDLSRVPDPSHMFVDYVKVYR